MCDRRRKTTTEQKKKVVRPMPICSFCLGDEKCNRNGQREGFISCVDCGNSGHPSCLKFSAALTRRVKQTRWQCIDCKRCAKCGGIGRDENMLFCDSCDRGVHMKCCSPPLKEIPPGQWFCFLCESSAIDMLPSDNGSKIDGPSLASPAATKQNKRGSLSSTKKPKDTKFETQNCAVVTKKTRVQRVPQKLSKVNQTSSQARTGHQTVTPRNLSDGLTQFFTPSNKRRTRVSCVSLEGIAAAKTDSSRDRRTKLCRKRKAVGVALKLSHHRAANRLIKKSQHIQRKQIQKENEAQKMNYQLRVLAELHDGLTKYFTARGQRRSMFRRTDHTDNTSSVSSIQASSPAAVKKRRRSQRGDHVELLFDGLTHFFTARGKRPSTFRKPDEESREPVPAKKESLIERRKRQHKHRTQVQLLFDGLSKFFTARNARRSKESIHSPRPYSIQKMSSSESKDDKKDSPEQSKCKKRKLEDIYVLPQLSLKSNAKRLRSSAPTLSNSQRAASRIVEKSRQFKAKKENKKVFRRRCGESCQLKSLFDGLSHLYTAQGERQRKSFNFYCLSVRHRTCTGDRSLSVGTTKLENVNELSKRSKLSNQEASVRSLSSQKTGSTAGSNWVKEKEEDDFKDSRVVARNNAVNKKVARHLEASGKKIKKRTLSRSDVKCLSDGVTKEDVELFNKARADCRKRFISKEGASALESGQAQTGPGCIEIGKYEITAWHSSPYPLDYASLSKLYLCEFCLKCFKSRVVVKSHMTKCILYHPPGDEIYRSGSLSVYEVDGKVNKQYCQNLCLFAKLFLDHKTLYYDVEPFLFYILTHTDDAGSHLIGYFSKEKYCQQKYNLSCIMTLPPYQRKGYGRFLIEFSYLLSRLEGQPGSPEKPLSDLGRVSYCAFWKSVVVEYLHKQKDLSNISIMSISEATGLTPGDIVTTLQSLDMMQVKDSKCIITVRRSVLDEHLAKVRARQVSHIPLKEDALRWSPFVAILGNERDEKAVCELPHGKESAFADPSGRKGRREARRSVSGNLLSGPAQRSIQKAEERCLRSHGLEGRRNNDVDAFVAGKKYQLNRRRMDAESLEKHDFDKGLDHKVIKEDSCDCSDVSMGKNAQADTFNRRVERQQLLDSVPHANGNVCEKHNQQRLRKSFSGGKKTDRGRVSCSNRSPQIYRDYPNKPRKRTKSSYSALCNLATKERKGSSVECQSESRDSSEKSSEVSDGISTVSASCNPSCSSDNKFVNERVRLHPCVASTSDSGQRTSSFDLLPGSVTSSAEGQDAEELDEDCVAKVKNLRAIVDAEHGNEILPDVLNASQKAMHSPFSDSWSVSGEAIATNQDEGFSSSAEDGLDSIETVGKVKETQVDRISQSRKKQDTVLLSSNPNVTAENKLTETKLFRESLASESGLAVTGSISGKLAGSEVVFTAQGCAEKVLAESMCTSFSRQLTSASEKLNSRGDANSLQNLDSELRLIECENRGLGQRDLTVSTSAIPKARKSHTHLLESFEVNDAHHQKKHVDLGVSFSVQRTGAMLNCTEVAEEVGDNSRTLLTTWSPTEMRKKAVHGDAMAMENGVNEALDLSELSVLGTCLGEDRAEVGSTPSCSEFGSTANYESEDEKKMDGSFDSTTDFKDSPAAERCEAPDYAELFGFQMGDLQDRMDRQTFGQTQVNESPTESVDGTTSPGDAKSAAGNTVPTGNASFHSTSDTTLVPVQSLGDRTGSSLVSPSADDLPVTGAAEQSSCPITAISSPLSDSYILTPSPTNSTPLSVSVASPSSPVGHIGGSTAQPHVASTAGDHVPVGSNSRSGTYRRSSSRPLPYPDASSICKLKQLTSQLDGSASNSDDVTTVGVQQAAFLRPSSVACATPSPAMRKTPLSCSLELCPANRVQPLVPGSNQSDSAFIPMQCCSPFLPPSQQSCFTDGHPSLVQKRSSQMQSFQAMMAYDRYPHENDVAGSTTQTRTSPSFRHQNHHSAFHSHIPNLNFLQPSQFTPSPNFSYVANPASRRNSDCQSNILTPPPSVERSHQQSCNNQTLAYPFSYWIGSCDQSYIRMRDQDLGCHSLKRSSLPGECLPVNGLESSVNSSEDCFYNIPYLNSVVACTVSSAHSRSVDFAM